MRETHEEIGVAIDKINIIGSLTPFYVPVSKFKIFPFVGWAVKKPKTVMHSIEVERIFSPSIKNLMLKKMKKEKKGILTDKSITIPYYDLGGEVVWGATSVILAEFKMVLEDIV